MKLKLTKEQKIAHKFLSAFDTTESRLLSSLVLLEKAESIRTSITSSIDNMGMSSDQSDKMHKALTRMDDSIEKITELSEVFADQFAEIEGFITEVQRHDQAAGRVLRLTYLHGLTVKEVSKNDELQCSKKTVYEHLKRGLDISYDLLLEY